MGRTRKRCEGHAKHKKAANEEVKNSRAVTGVVTYSFIIKVLILLMGSASKSNFWQYFNSVI